jgi:hypothetical protein
VNAIFNGTVSTACSIRVKPLNGKRPQLLLWAARGKIAIIGIAIIGIAIIGIAIIGTAIIGIAIIGIAIIDIAIIGIAIIGIANRLHCSVMFIAHT